VDGIEASPALDSNSIFDFVPGLVSDGHTVHSTVSSHSMERFAAGLAGGKHVVTVQYQNAPGTSFDMLGWLLTVERAQS
jgi:hypothetical protein